MSVRNLDRVFNPKRVAIVGASDNTSSVGYAVLNNMIGGGFQGVVYPVNPKREAVQGIAAYKSLEALPNVPDLVVICTPAFTVPGIVKSAVELGVKGICVISAGFREAGEEGIKLEQEVLAEIAKGDGVRMIGPNCLGVIVPGIGLNASFTVGTPKPGNIAFITQSGALGTSVLDWAIRKGIGFSQFVSVGNMAEADFADLIDYFGQDSGTDAILVYIESIANARAFVSAARAFTKTKPIIAYKAGRFAESAAAAASHTGALMGADDVHDAAFRRAGIERVYEIDDMFDCAELLGRRKVPRGGRLAIVTNAGGPGVMATDALIARGGTLAKLSSETMEELNAALPAYWSHNNPIDVLGDAPPERYAVATSIVADDPNVDAVLVILTPQAMTDATAAAEAVADVVHNSNKLVLTAWAGGASVIEGRELLSQRGIPAYPTPERAIQGLMHLVNYQRNIAALYETPRDVPVELELKTEEIKPKRTELLSTPNTTLSEVDGKALLKSYGIPVAETLIATTEDQAVTHAEAIGYPVVMKILSPDITHKTDVGGVRLNLANEDDVRYAWQRMMQRAAEVKPDAQLDGATVQPMIDTRDSVEMILGAIKDPVFGSVILLGFGGVTAEVWQDRVLGLPPLTEKLADNMINSLKSKPLLEGYRGAPKADKNALIEAMIRFSYLIADSPNIAELDINPLLVGPTGTIALDARVMTDDAPVTPDARLSHLAIHPYQAKLEESFTLADGSTVVVRPIRPADEPAWHDMVASCSPDTLQARFFQSIGKTTHAMATRYCYIDYDREMALVAMLPADSPDGEEKMIGVGRLICEPDGRSAEYAVLVADGYQGQGLGLTLTERCLDVARAMDVQRVYGTTSVNNPRMVATFKDHGFEIAPDPEDDSLVTAELALT
ncbi:bifunctional acetate--CoA ligase family protein/GNAT family N-acetyltransferase [Algisphaera agarilytica]|uniref:Acetyltransferase n=1 Tax=Algisphaera agarilytica TaxID=1385975 RepID=A0A7X0H7F3_9BACT|nr:GNAT family N-acetyltransferase [Algisphaera agarilytica]MBB6430432.1 acetyltransferase [Algisphaera agarilytica]